MGAIVFLMFFMAVLSIYPATCFFVWIFKYRKEMSFGEFERRFDL